MDRDQLLNDIQSFPVRNRLKPTKTVDKSNPVIIAEGEKLKAYRNSSPHTEECPLSPQPPPPPPPAPFQHGSEPKKPVLSLVPDRDALLEDIRRGITLKKVHSVPPDPPHVPIAVTTGLSEEPCPQDAPMSPNRSVLMDQIRRGVNLRKISVELAKVPGPIGAVRRSKSENDIGKDGPMEKEQAKVLRELEMAIGNIGIEASIIKPDRPGGWRRSRSISPKRDICRIQLIPPKSDRDTCDTLHCSSQVLPADYSPPQPTQPPEESMEQPSNTGQITRAVPIRQVGKGERENVPTCCNNVSTAMPSRPNFDRYGRRSFDVSIRISQENFESLKRKFESPVKNKTGDRNVPGSGVEGASGKIAHPPVWASHFEMPYKKPSAIKRPELPKFDQVNQSDQPCRDEQKLNPPSDQDNAKMAQLMKLPVEEMKNFRFAINLDERNGDILRLRERCND